MHRAGMIERRKDELEAIHRKTRELLTIYRSLHSRADVDRLHWRRKSGGKRLISVEKCVKKQFPVLRKRTRTKTTNRSNN